ncbi:MAG TPA: lipoprotein-releasing ABC transporter permease subunit [Stellaceae bacterium]|nr:lipoprotein-releasing ABC transporter permease subunit [Stellaceae bacterium]
MAFDAFERMVAFRYLRARRQEGFISVIAIFSLLGIMLGVATLIIVMSVMNGFRVELLGRIIGLNGHLGVYAAQGSIADYAALAGRVKQIPGVVAVHPMIEGQVLASANGRSTGVLVRGMSEADVAGETLLASHVVAGSLDRFADDTVMLGDKLAFKLGLKLGDPITLLSPNGQATAFGSVPRVKTYRVGALFDVGMYEYDSNFVFMPLPAAQLYFLLPDAVSTLQVFVADPDQARAIGYAVRQQLGGQYQVYDWQQSNSAYFGAVQVERNVMFIILSLIILVAAFNIISSMIMLVKDKTRDIAILRTMGATRGMVLRIFMLSGASIGVVGTLLGFVLGVAFTTHIEQIRALVQDVLHVNVFNAEIYFLTQIPARIDPHEVVMVLAMAFGLSFLATLYPSWRAARLDPVEALRYE